jgi:hypothetical protein
MNLASMDVPDFLDFAAIHASRRLYHFTTSLYVPIGKCSFWVLILLLFIGLDCDPT